MSISYDFLKAVIDTAADHIAVIDHDGEILYVNQGWTDFGKRNGEPATTNWVGLNYLTVCDISTGEDSLQSSDVANGIRGVINSNDADFHCEYPCHTHDEQRWFQMRATPFQLDDERFVVISHSDITEQKLAEARIIHLSRVDGLTGLANRRYFDEFFANEWSRCTRAQMPITLAMIDIDYFKHLNDALGHHAGDDCLKIISTVLKQYAKRPSDICARYGGDEFMVMYGNTALDEALVLILKLMDAIRKHEIPNPDSLIGPSVTISIGLATAYPKMNTSEEDLIRAADKLLYAAKDGGRDHVEFANLDW